MYGLGTWRRPEHQGMRQRHRLHHHRALRRRWSRACGQPRRWRHCYDVATRSRAQNQEGRWQLQCRCSCLWWTTSLPWPVRHARSWLSPCRMICGAEAVFLCQCPGLPTHQHHRRRALLVFRSSPQAASSDSCGSFTTIFDSPRARGYPDARVGPCYTADGGRAFSPISSVEACKGLGHHLHRPRRVC